MGRTGLVHGPGGIGDQMRAGFWKTGRPDQVLNYDHLEIRPLGPDHALAKASTFSPERANLFELAGSRRFGSARQLDGG
jgi:hypothetical protein